MVALMHHAAWARNFDPMVFLRSKRTVAIPSELCFFTTVVLRVDNAEAAPLPTTIGENLSKLIMLSH